MRTFSNQAFFGDASDFSWPAFSLAALTFQRKAARPFITCSYTRHGVVWENYHAGSAICYNLPAGHAGTVGGPAKLACQVGRGAKPACRARALAGQAGTVAAYTKRGDKGALR